LANAANNFIAVPYRLLVCRSDRTREARASCSGGCVGRDASGFCDRAEYSDALEGSRTKASLFETIMRYIECHDGNGTAIVTGMYPGKSGYHANHVYRPDIDPHHSIDVELPAVVKKGDEVSGGKYILVPTIAELVQHAGGAR